MNTDMQLVQQYIHTALNTPLENLTDALIPFFADSFTCKAFRPVERTVTTQNNWQKSSGNL